MTFLSDSRWNLSSSDRISTWPHWNGSSRVRPRGSVEEGEVWGGEVKSGVAFREWQIHSPGHYPFHLPPLLDRLTYHFLIQFKGPDDTPALAFQRSIGEDLLVSYLRAREEDNRLKLHFLNTGYGSLGWEDLITDELLACLYCAVSVIFHFT